MMPKACNVFTGFLEDGQTAKAARTCGDGACSLHSIWGTAIYNPTGNEYYCENARRKLCESMPTDVNTMLNSAYGSAVRAILDKTWSGTVDYVIGKTQQESIPGESMGVEVFWKHLALDRQTMIGDFV